jgi:plasmid stability protein
MASALIRDLDDQVYEQLKARAASNHRSLEAELREILVAASRQVSDTEARDQAALIRRRLAGRAHSDSATLIREDRDAR